MSQFVTSRTVGGVGRPGRSLILTSNRSPADWYPLFPNAVVGESILDRVLNTSHHLLLDGKSYRPRRRPGQHKPPARATADGDKQDLVAGELAVARYPRRAPCHGYSGAGP